MRGKLKHKVPNRSWVKREGGEMRSLYENSRGRGSEVEGIERGKEGQKLVV